MKQVFISYSRQDHICANYIKNYLKKRNYNVWIDSDKILIDSNWKDSINEGIKESDFFVAILSSNSIKRTEVLKEIEIAFDKKKSDNNFSLFFVVLGEIHKAWFNESNLSNMIIEYLEKYQYIKLDYHGRVTSEKMKLLYDALINGKPDFSSKKNVFQSSNYIYSVFQPQNLIYRVSDDIDINYYKCYKYELSPSTVFIRALDNQWLPDSIMEDPKLRSLFYGEGFTNSEIKKIISKEQEDSLLVSLFNHRQIIINRANLLSNESLYKLFVETEECKEFLLKNGSIIILLYEAESINPFISQNLKYGVSDVVKEKWNSLCQDIPLYVIRENWDNPTDKHSIEIAKFCTTLGYDYKANEALMYDLKIENNKEEFLRILKTIGMEVGFNINSTGNELEMLNRVYGYTRSRFYNRYVTKYRKTCNDSIKNCIFDEKKEFHYELKKLIDSFYNMIIVNSFNCDVVLPLDNNIHTYLLDQFFVNKSDQILDLEEIKYIFDELLYKSNGVSTKDRLISLLSNFNDSIYLSKWDLLKVINVRKTNDWEDYIDFVESLIVRSRTFRVYFDQLEELVTKASKLLIESEKTWKPTFSFRICIGNSLLYLIFQKERNQIKIYGNGKTNNETNVRLKIDFLIGNFLSSNKIIFDPICLFNGSTFKQSESDYLNELKKFFLNNDFIEINN